MGILVISIILSVVYYYVWKMYKAEEIPVGLFFSICLVGLIAIPSGVKALMVVIFIFAYVSEKYIRYANLPRTDNV